MSDDPTQGLSGTPAPPGSASDPAGRFRRILFARVPAEDLAPYDEAGLAQVAEAAYGHLEQPRPAGTPAITLTDTTLDLGGKLVEISILDVVNDDVPFLLDSTLTALAQHGQRPTLVAHPILAVERDADGGLERLIGEAGVAAHPGTGEPPTAPAAPAESAAQAAPAPAATRESFIHIHLPRVGTPEGRDRLVAALTASYGDVAAVARDAGAMREQLAGLAQEYRAHPPPLPEAEREEAIAFLEWLSENHFTLLGMRASRIPDREGAPEPLAGSGLGLLRDPAIQVLKRGGELVAITPEIRAFLDQPQALFVTKASVRSRVSRGEYLDYVAAKLFSPSAGRLWGELAIVGLFTGSAYASPAGQTPYLRRKVAAVQERAGFDPASFAGRSLSEILEAYPRDDLFQIDVDTLSGFATELLRLQEHPRVRALARADRFGRFVSVLVYLPRERDGADIRERIGRFLAVSYGGRVSAVYPAAPAGALTRTHFIIGRDGGEVPDVPRETLEAGIVAIARTWGDRLGDALAEALGGPRARELAGRFGEAFGPDYRDAFDAPAALADIGRLDRLSEALPRAVDLVRHDGEPDSRLHLKLFSRGVGLPLSERVPLLERMGFRVLDERTYRVAPADAAPDAIAWIHDMALERATGAPVDIAAVETRLEAALLAVFRGVAESDGFNRLVLEGGLGWRDAAMVRALARYLQQLTIPYTPDYLADVAARHGELVARIVALFYARFEPHDDEGGRPGREAAARVAVEEGLGDVTSLDDDRILRRLLNLVEAAVRTNFFRIGPDGLPPEVIAFKFEGARVDAMPAPRPLYEIFMNAPRVEALHLRFGKVARGGIRWTDRPQDFRTEVLGLVKAQQVKNAVIVPVGAKGGFFPKRLPPASDRAAWLAEGTQAYRVFIGTLLDLTDNIAGESVTHPADTVRHDGDDPYLVVAADKGTATFSDIANAISLERGHWLGDAFASGGSNGYDHKQMGITARGAWEAVKRHFREEDVDIGRDPVTVVGVGDMSGDVFGNGTLLSRTMKLVAAFDHRDIFLDPDPEPEIAHAERERLFGLPRSSWQDYDRALLSEGGGVFSRAAKSIALSPPVQAALGIARGEASPAELIAAILRAPVGLLWFGGIGTYVRASDETDAAAGDRANDPVRITGAQIRARVVGEGANLGMTQRGRIEAARHGVRLNTDAIDNSAGVNTSDVEVNIKIALAVPERDGRLTAESRNALLHEMTDEVAELVLRNNYLQTLSLSLAERRGLGDLGFQARLMAVLESSGRLDRAIEFLPDETALAARRQEGRGLTRPELAVLLAYAKLALHDELLASSVPDDPYLGRELERYFPSALRERFPYAVAGHRLRREIISTQLANAIVNRGGPAIVTRLVDDTGADATTIAAAYAATRDALGLTDIYRGIDALDGRIGGQRQLSLYADIQELMLSRIVWFIRNVDFKTRSLDDVVGQYGAGIAEVAAALEGALPPPRREAWAARAAALATEKVPDELARRLASLPDLAAAPDIVLVARRTGRTIAAVAQTHFAVGALFRLGELSEAAEAVPIGDHYDRLARDRAVDAVSEAHRRLTQEVLAGGQDGGAALSTWRAARGGEADRIRSAVDGIVASGLSVSKMTVAASLIGDLAKA